MMIPRAVPPSTMKAVIKLPSQGNRGINCANAPAMPWSSRTTAVTTMAPAAINPTTPKPA